MGERLQPDDRDLVGRFCRGDEEAFRLLFRRHSPRLYALAWRLLAGRPHDVDDAVQEAWMRAAAKLPDFEWRSALSTWLSAILINCARERLRDRTPPMADADATARLQAPAAGDRAIDLDRAIASLPDRPRAVLVLHDVEGYTHQEIGDLLGLAVGTSKSHLFRARRALREVLSRSAGPAPARPDGAVSTREDRHAG